MGRGSGFTCGVGYSGTGPFVTYTGPHKETREYRIWLDMLKRCYSEKYQADKPTYVGCTVEPVWHDFQRFAAWFTQDANYQETIDWQLDKDLLVENNKLYGPSYCCRLPRKINMILQKSRSKASDLPQGVKPHRTGTKWRVDLAVNGVPTYIGLYDSIVEAAVAYRMEKHKECVRLADEYRHQLPDRIYERLLTYLH